MCALAVQVIAPIGGAKPYPALDGIFSNPIVLPIVGGQIALLAGGLLFSSPEKQKEKAN